MADLEFKRSVQEVPAAQSLPEPYQRKVGVEVTSMPDIQAAVSSYASATNWMSNIGSAVAAKASNAVASKLGTELGKKPQGDLSMPLTEFDKTMYKSYQAQAQSTLGLQANELIQNANIQMAKMPRLSPEQIAKTNQSIGIGLQNIFKNAPVEIRPDLEYRYGTIQLNMASDMTERMIKEQRQDQYNNTTLASKNNAEHAYSLALNGNFDAAESAVNATEQANKADIAAGTGRTPEEAKVNTDSARKSMEAGRMIYEYEQARKDGKEAEHLKNLADKKPDWISDNNYPSALSALGSHITQQQTLRAQDQNFAMAGFKVKLAENPIAISGSDIAELNSHLTPQQQQEMNLQYVNAINKLQKKSAGVDEALSGYTDINKMSGASTDSKNGAWQAVTNNIMQQPESVASGMTEDEAKLRAASIAPTPIPAYNQEINAKLSTADPNNLEAAGQALNYMMSHNLGQNLNGVGAEQKAMADLYGKLRNVMPPLEAAQKAHEAIFNKSPEQKKANDEALADYYQSQKKNKESTFGLVGNLINLSKDLVIRNMPGYRKDATNIFETYFKITNGDVSSATKLTKQYMDTQYGESYINGGKELTLHPIENLPGVPHDGIGAIQADIVEQSNKSFQADKKMFDEGKADHWFEARQRINPEEAATSKKVYDAIYQGYKEHPVTGAIFDVHMKREELAKHSRILREFNSGQGVTIVKHNRNGKDEVFEGAVQANPWAKRTGNPAQPVAGGYDIQIKTDRGFTNIPLNNALTTSVQYNPRVDYIQQVYMQTKGYSAPIPQLPYSSESAAQNAFIQRGLMQ